MDISKILISGKEIKLFPGIEEPWVSSHIHFAKKLLENMVHTHESQQPCRSKFHPIQEGGEGESIQGDGDRSHAGHYQVSAAVAKSSVSK